MPQNPKVAPAANASAVAASKTLRLEQLARRYYKPLASFFRKRTRNAPEVDDLVQQVFLRLAQRGDGSQIDHAEGYLFQTATNTLKDHYRHEGALERLARDSNTLQMADDSDFSAERVLIGRETLERVVMILRELPERTCDIVVMRWFDGLKYAEIAHLHGISVRAVRKHMTKALFQLGQVIQFEGQDSSGPDD